MYIGNVVKSVSVPILNEENRYTHYRIPAFQIEGTTFYLHEKVKLISNMIYEKGNTQILSQSIEPVKPENFQITSEEGIPIIRDVYSRYPDDVIASFERLAKLKPCYFIYNKDGLLALTARAQKDWNAFPNLVLKDGLFFMDRY